jgi:hypothetical protein
MRTRGGSYILALIVGVLSIAATTAAASASGSSVSPAKLKALTNSINHAKHLTYEATYKSVSPGGQTQTVTIAQSPPKTVFSASNGSVINTGKKTYYCSNSSGSTTCLTESGGNPFIGLEDLFSPTLALTAFSEAKQGIVARALGIRSTLSSATFAGQSSTCVSVTVRGKGEKFCVTKQGFLSYSGGSGSYFEMTKFSGSPPSSLFAIPSGATTVTLPGGGTIPSIPTTP